MKVLVLGLAASLALLAAPSLAADQKASDGATKPMSEMTDAELHAHCKALMGQKMEGHGHHHHASAHPLSDAEMKAQHEKCTAIMAKASAGLKK